MTYRPEADERWLLARIAEAWEEVDPVPETVPAFARNALGLLTLDADLARLVSDTAEQLTAGIRGDVGPRLLTFETQTLSVEVEVLPTGPGRRLLGQLVPPRAAQVQVRHAGGVAQTEADDLGRFAVSGIAAGAVSIVCRFPGHDVPPVVTAWSTI